VLVQTNVLGTDIREVKDESIKKAG